MSSQIQVSLTPNAFNHSAMASQQRHGEAEDISTQSQQLGCSKSIFLYVWH